MRYSEVLTRASRALAAVCVGAVLVSGAAAQATRGRGLVVRVGSTESEAKLNASVNLWAVVIGVSRYKFGDVQLPGGEIPNLKSAADDAQRDVLRLFENLSVVQRLIERRQELATQEQLRQAQLRLDEGALTRAPRAQPGSNGSEDQGHGS